MLHDLLDEGRRGKCRNCVSRGRCDVVSEMNWKGMEFKEEGKESKRTGVLGERLGSEKYIEVRKEESGESEAEKVAIALQNVGITSSKSV